MKSHGKIKETVAMTLAAAIGIGLSTSTLRAEEEHEPKPPVAHEQHAPTTKPIGTAGPRVNLEHTMEDMGKKYKTLVKQAKDESKHDANLVLVTELEQLSLTAKTANPPLRRFPEADRPKMADEYKKMMGSLLSGFTDLESAIIDKDAKKIDESINAINEIMKQGHEEMKVKKEGGEGHEEHEAH